MADGGFGGPILLDNSAWARAGMGRLGDSDRARWEDAIRADELVVCPPFTLEALYSARDPEDLRSLATELGGFRQVPADGSTWQLAAAAQAALAADPAVSHRVKPINLLLAAVADQHRLAVLHYDHDFDTIRQHTPLRYRSVWIARRRTVD